MRAEPSLPDLMIPEIPALRCYARFLCRDRDRADDLVQSCLLRAIDKLDTFEPGSKLRAWLFTILRNLFLDEIRRGGVEMNWHSDELADAKQPVIDEAQTTTILLHELESALFVLPEEQREVMLLVAIEGMTYQAAADLQGVPVGTVRSRLCRARRSLLMLLEGRESESCPARHEAAASTGARFNAPGDPKAAWERGSAPVSMAACGSQDHPWGSS